MIFLKHFLKQLGLLIKTIFKQNLFLDPLYFSQNKLMLSEPHGGIIICILFNLNFAHFAIHLQSKISSLYMVKVTQDPCSLINSLAKFPEGILSCNA